MPLLKTIINREAFRLLLGSTFSGVTTYAFVHTYQPITWIAVITAALTGAFFFISDNIIEAAIKAGTSGTSAYLVLGLTPRLLSRDPQSWAVVLLALVLGCSIATAIGSILGTISRCIWEHQPPHKDSDVQKHQ